MYSLQVNVTKRYKCVVLPWECRERLAIAAVHSVLDVRRVHIESLWGGYWEDDGKMTGGWGDNGEEVQCLFKTNFRTRFDVSGLDSCDIE